MMKNSHDDPMGDSSKQRHALASVIRKEEALLLASYSL